MKYWEQTCLSKYIIRQWSLSPKNFLLADNQAHVWRIDLELLGSNPNQYDGILTQDELSRSQRFYFQADRIRFASTRAVMRIILGNYLNIEPGNLNLKFSPYGKPYLANKSTEENLTFNVSHTGNFSLLAVTRNRRIGVDIERIRNEASLEAIAKRFFTPEEANQILLLPETLRPEAFFTCWTRKEAFIKAQGEGLSIPLNQFEVTLSPDEIPQLIYSRNSGGHADMWQIYHLEPGAGYIGALAVEGKRLKVVGWDWRGDPE
jgi:4'-phosphopantetheinyl transferase